MTAVGGIQPLRRGLSRDGCETPLPFFLLGSSPAMGERRPPRERTKASAALLEKRLATMTPTPDGDRPIDHRSIRPPGNKFPPRKAK